MICEWCEAELPRVVKSGRSRRFCSARCRQAACRARKAERPSAGLSGAGGLVLTASVL